MTSSVLLAAMLAWGVPFGATPRKDAYLGVIEKLSGDPVWVRVSFKRDQDGNWSPTLVQKPRDHEDLNAATAALPARITWRICRDGRSLGTVISARRPIARGSQLGTQALRSSPPAAVGAAPNDERYRIIMTEQAAARPFVISTLPDACAAASSARRAADDAVARVTRLVLAQRNLQTGKPNRLMDARGWQAGDWTIVDLTLEEDGAWLAVVAFALEDDIRYTVKGARVVDWISADGDAVPDVVLWIDGFDRSGYLLVYGKFEKQAAFDWSYK